MAGATAEASCPHVSWAHHYKATKVKIEVVRRRLLRGVSWENRRRISSRAPENASYAFIHDDRCTLTGNAISLSYLVATHDSIEH